MPDNVAAFEAMGYTSADAWLLDTCGLLPEDLDGWTTDDAIALARAVNHNGIDALMAEWLFQTFPGDVAAAMEAM